MAKRPDLLSLVAKRPLDRISPAYRMVLYDLKLGGMRFRIENRLRIISPSNAVPTLPLIRFPRRLAIYSPLKRPSWDRYGIRETRSKKHPPNLRLAWHDRNAMRSRDLPSQNTRWNVDNDVGHRPIGFGCIQAVFAIFMKRSRQTFQKDTTRSEEGVNE